MIPRKAWINCFGSPRSGLMLDNRQQKDKHDGFLMRAKQENKFAK